MRTVTVKKQEFLKILKANRLKHEKAYKEALSDRIKSAKIKLNELLNDIEHGIDLDEDLHFPKPRCHSKDYDEIIMMMEMEVQNEVSLTQDEFSKYVQDQWHWKSDFDFISSSYKRR
tara:strand:- start:12158 stop:12508 length:351 start_codon:yes stop_codon:yes gene_type:complete